MSKMMARIRREDGEIACTLRFVQRGEPSPHGITKQPCYAIWQEGDPPDQETFYSRDELTRLRDVINIYLGLESP